MDSGEIKRRIAQPRFDAEVVARFLCNYHGVTDVAQIEPFGRRQYAYNVCRETVLPVEVTADVGTLLPTTTVFPQPLGNPQPKQRFQHPVSGQPMDADLDRVFIYSIACRSYSNETGVPIAVRMNFYHEPMAQLQQTREQDAMFAAAGAPQAAFAVLEPTNVGESRDMVALPLIETKFAYQNGPFVRTMALVDETNIMNGIVVIPPDVCREARLPIWLGDNEAFMPSQAMIDAALKAMQATPQSAPAMREMYINNYRREMLTKYAKAKRSTHFMALPINHILSWAFHSENYRNSGDQTVEEFRFHNDDPAIGTVMLYYLVPSTLFDHTIECWRQAWAGKVDCRPLTSVGFQFMPISYGSYTLDSSAIKGNIKMRAHMTYYSAPSLSPATRKELAPALALHFPSCHQWSVSDMERDAAIRQMLSGGGGGGGTSDQREMQKSK